MKYTKRLIVLMLALVVCTTLSAQEAEPEPEKEGPAVSSDAVEVMRKELRVASDKGLEWLAANQSNSGAFGSGYVVASTSMCGLSFLAHGHVPGRGKYGEVVTKAIRYLLDNQGRSGYITEPDGSSRMHGHGYAVLFLAEAYGMASGVPGFEMEDLRTAVQKGVDVIEASQSHLGGWFYNPVEGGMKQTRDEGSVTVTQIEALRSARNAGITVDPKSIEKGVEYMVKSANPDGTFKYSLGMGNHRGSYALAAAGLCVLNFLGNYDGPEVTKAREYILKALRSGSAGAGGHYYYASYYCGIALHQTGHDTWLEGYPKLAKDLLKHQSANGSFSGGRSPALDTAMALIVFALPDAMLPIHQK